MNAILPETTIATRSQLNAITIPVVGIFKSMTQGFKHCPVTQKLCTQSHKLPDIDAAGLDAMVRDLNALPHCDGHKQFEYDCIDCADTLPVRPQFTVKRCSNEPDRKLFVVRPDGSETEVRDRVVPFSGADKLVVREGGGAAREATIEEAAIRLGGGDAHDAEQWGAPGVKLGDPEEKPATITRPDGTTREVQPMDGMNYGDAVTAGDRPIQVVDPITGMELIVPPGETYRAQRDTSKTWPPGCAFRDYDEDESAWWPLAVAVICTVIVTGYMIWRLAH